MLVCDLDGTLLNGAGIMTEPTIAALTQAAESGIEVAFATGRRHDFAWKVLDPARLHPATVLISSNGAITRTLAGDRMHRTTLAVQTALQLCAHLNDFRDSLIFTFEHIGPGALAVEDIEALYRRIPRWVDSNRHEIRSWTPLEAAFQSGEPPIQAMICGTLACMEAAMLRLDHPSSVAVNLRRKLSVHRTEYATRNLSIVDLMPSGCSKGNAIARLAAERGIDAAEIACIGDNMNDADMLMFAGHAIVMKNAPAELLRMAAENGWSLTASNEEDGAAQAILRMLEAAEETGRPSSQPAPARIG